VAKVLEEDEGEEKAVDELGSGAVFGEMALLARARRSASIRTATASTRVRMPRAVLQPLLEAIPTCGGRCEPQPREPRNGE